MKGKLGGRRYCVSIVCLLLLAGGSVIGQTAEERLADPLTSDGVHKRSPFGFHPGEPLRLALEIGACWNRAQYIHWPGVQRSKEEIENGIFHWDRLDRYFAVQTRAGMNVVTNLTHIWSERNPSPYLLNSTSYLTFSDTYWKKFVRAAVERYDGDGMDDAPRRPIVRYFQLENESNLQSYSSGRTPETYAQLARITHRAMKAASPRAKLLISGAAGSDNNLSKALGWYERVFKELEGGHMDVFDFHFFEVPGKGLSSYREIGTAALAWRELLDKYGFSKVPIWMTENGTYSGTLNRRLGGSASFRSEDEQAEDLLKRYVVSLAAGVKKVFWAFGLREGFGPADDDFWDHTGLIYDGKGNDDRGAGVKKKSYHAYRLMTDKLEGSDWDDIQIIQEQHGLWIYRFLRNENPIWVAWNDNAEEERVTISGITASRVKITKAVPKRESIKGGTDFKIVFETKTQRVQDGRATISLGKTPVFVEEEKRAPNKET